METTDLNALAKTLRQANLGHVETVPPGWFTVTDLCKKTGMSVPHTGKMIRSALEKGVIEMQKFRIHAGSRIIPVFHYRNK